MCCDKCKKIGGLLLLVFGVIFLLKDVGVWNFWGVNWWTVLLLMGGLGTLCGAHCKDCCTDAKKKK